MVVEMKREAISQFGGETRFNGEKAHKFGEIIVTKVMLSTPPDPQVPTQPAAFPWKGVYPLTKRVV